MSVRYFMAFTIRLVAMLLHHGEAYAALDLERRRLTVRMMERMMLAIVGGFAASWMAR